MTKVQRYEWEDAILKAERLGLLPAPTVNMALRLASAINWVPKDKRPSGLYWKNETALNHVGSSRATYFRVKNPLFEYGFFVEERGNLIPLLPDLSQYETDESQVETEESHIETEESQSDTPYTVNTYTDNSLSDNSLSDNARAVGASQPAVVPPADSTLENDFINKNDEEVPGATRRPGSSYSLNSPIVLNSSNTPGSPINEKGTVVVKTVEEEAQSQVETDRCPQCKEPDFEAFCFPCGFVGVA